MLRRIVYIERGAIVGVCAIAPLLAALLQVGNTQIPTIQDLLFPLIWLIPLLGAGGAALGVLVHRSHATGHVQWGGHEETSSLLKQGVAELVSGQPDTRLNDAAMAQANAQEGRAAAIYLINRMAQIRQSQVLKAAWPNPMRWTKRAAWSFNLLLVSATALMIPPALASGLNGLVFIIPGLLLLPIWFTGILICGLGQKNADAWLRKLPGREYKPKLKPRGNRTVAGSWHTKESRQDLPIIRGLIIVLLVIAGALYFLREYTGGYFSYSEDRYAVSETQATTPPQPVAQADNATRNAPTSTLRPAPARPAPEPTPDTRVRSSMEVWSKLPPQGVILQVDANTLAFAGWDINEVSNAFDQTKKRLDELYLAHLRDHPGARGRITLQLKLQPWGGVSDIQTIASEFNDAAFMFALIDRLEAIKLKAGALDPVPVLLSMDFRP